MKQIILRKDLFIFNLSSCTTSDADIMPLTYSSHFNIDYVCILCIAIQSNLHLLPAFFSPLYLDLAGKSMRLLLDSESLEISITEEKIVLKGRGELLQWSTAKEWAQIIQETLGFAYTGSNTNFWVGLTW